MAVSPDNRWIATGGEDGLIRMVPVPPPLEGTGEWVRRWVEVNAALALDPSDDVVYLDSATWRERLARLVEHSPAGQ